MNEPLTNEGILKEEKVGYLKSKINLMQGTLYLTPNRLALEANKSGVGGMGLLGSLLKKKVEKSNFIFDLEFKDISDVSQGKHGAEKNVLEITDNQNNTYRVVVKNYDDWGNELNKMV